VSGGLYLAVTPFIFGIRSALSIHFTNSLSEASSIHRISPGEFLARIADLINKVSLVQVVC